MTSRIEALREEFGSIIATMSGALAAGNEQLFLAQLE